MVPKHAIERVGFRCHRIINLRLATVSRHDQGARYDAKARIDLPDLGHAGQNIRILHRGGVQDIIGCCQGGSVRHNFAALNALDHRFAVRVKRQVVVGAHLQRLLGLGQLQRGRDHTLLRQLGFALQHRDADAGLLFLVLARVEDVNHDQRRHIVVCKRELDTLADGISQVIRAHSHLLDRLIIAVGDLGRQRVGKVAHIDRRQADHHLHCRINLHRCHNLRLFFGHFYPMKKCHILITPLRLNRCSQVQDWG